MLLLIRHQKDPGMIPPPKAEMLSVNNAHRLKRGVRNEGCENHTFFQFFHSIEFPYCANFLHLQL
jgi:hypothetical protein